MKRVVTAIDSGDYTEKGEVISVPYLVFEIAQGNIKTYQAMNNPDLVWKLKAFHGALLGLRQLHKANIVHQDLKPSNILIFGNTISKISDLGSATQLNDPSNWMKDNAVGDLRYAPIELLYKYYSPNWDTRRLGADLFMIGGLLTYLLSDSNFLSLMIDKIPESFKYHQFGGNFQQALSYIMKAYFQTLDEVKKLLPQKISSDLITVIGELSHPIPEERGNPRKLQITHRQYSLQRYISIIDRCHKKMLWSSND